MSVIFKCRIPEHDGEDEWTDVNEYTAQAAAEQYVDEEDATSAMELCQDGNEPLVIVKDGEGVEKKFKVSRDFSPIYFASEIDPKPEPASDIPV